MSKENITEFIILGLLTHQNASGYDLKKSIDHMISNFWEVGYGQLYPTLRSLQEGGYITGIPTPSTRGPDKIVYAITEPGKVKLATWLDQPEQKEYVKYEILLKLFFGSLLPQDKNIERVTAFQKSSQDKLNLMQLFMQNLESVLGESEDHTYYYLTVLFGKHVYQAYVDWAKEAIDILNKNEE